MEFLGLKLKNEILTYEFDLQFFAAEDEGRTELPTERKKQEARKEGRVLKSQDIVSLFVVVSGFTALFFSLPFISDHIVNIFRYYFQNDLVVNENNFRTIFLYGVKEFFLILLPIAATTLIVGIAANIAQVGFLFVPKLISPNLKKIIPNFSEYFKRIFGRRGIIGFVKSLILVFGALSILFFSLNGNIFKMLQSSGQNLQTTIMFFYSLIKSLILKIGILIILMVLIDYFYQRWEYIDSLKMSKEELKREIIEQEGHPEIKSALQKKRQEILKRKSLSNVKEADVVITNPTHIAVALKYEMGIDDAPKVVAKGQDLMAQKIKEIARDNDILIYENKPLARELYKRVDIGDLIPYDLFAAVADILSIVYKKKKSFQDDWSILNG